MTQQQAIELIQLHHENVHPNIIRLWLNERIRRFAHDAGLVRGYVDYTSVADQYRYKLIDSIQDVYRVDYNGVRLDRLSGEPPYIASVSGLPSEEVGP